MGTISYCVVGLSRRSSGTGRMALFAASQLEKNRQFAQAQENAKYARAKIFWRRSGILTPMLMTPQWGGNELSEKLHSIDHILINMVNIGIARDNIVQK